MALPNDVANSLLRASARWLMVVFALGLLLRSIFLWYFDPGFSWTNVLHAHSHTAYFGWAGLGLMGLMLSLLPGLTGRPLAGAEALKWVRQLAPWAVGGAMAAFLVQGYGPLSIAFSVVNEILWFLFSYVFWRQVRGIQVREWHPALWLMGAAVALLLASAGSTLVLVLTRVVLRTADVVLSNLGVYLFLQAYGDGWMEVGLMGVAVALAGGQPSRRSLAAVSLLALVLTVPAGLRLLAPFGLFGAPLWAGKIAGAGLAAAQTLFLASMWRERRRVPAAVRPWWGLAGAALAIKAVLELAPLLPFWDSWAADRQLVIAFLHLKLLALFTAGQIGAIGYSRRLGRGAAVFGWGTALMLGALALNGFWAGTIQAASRATHAAALVGAVLAAAGAASAVWPLVVQGAGSASAQD